MASTQEPKMLKTNASRRTPQATYVPLTEAQGTPGRATVKFSFVRQLSLQPGEVDSVLPALTAAAGKTDATLNDGSELWNMLRSFEVEEGWEHFRLKCRSSL